jgi:hypothetical protein
MAATNIVRRAYIMVLVEVGSMERAVIGEQVNRILRSRTFSSKSQLRKLLDILHKNMDSEVQMRPDQVIHELWPTEVRTKRSADVATEMNRLRHALESYYEEEGASDPVTIYLPNRSASTADGTHETRWMSAKRRLGSSGGTNPASGASIFFSANAGTISNGTTSGSKVIATTNASGIASVTLTLPDRHGHRRRSLRPGSSDGHFHRNVTVKAPFALRSFLG